MNPSRAALFWPLLVPGTPRVLNPAAELLKLPRAKLASATHRRADLSSGWIDLPEQIRLSGHCMEDAWLEGLCSRDGVSCSGLVEQVAVELDQSNRCQVTRGP